MGLDVQGRGWCRGRGLGSRGGGVGLCEAFASGSCGGKGGCMIHQAQVQE